MIKVKEYLDKNLFSDGETTATLKKNGHYEVSGYWEYPKDISKSENKRISELMISDPQLKTWIPKDQMSFIINNETMVIRMIIINGVSASPYGYLQTYDHIPRIGPDKNGLYLRSTDEEIIKFIDDRLQKIKKCDLRDIKLSKLGI